MLAVYDTAIRSLSDIGSSTAANDGQAFALFWSLKNPRGIPANTAPVFRGLPACACPHADRWSRICLTLLRLVTNSTIGQAPRYQMYHAFALYVVAWTWLQHPQAKVRGAGWCFAGGVVLFSGSLYLLALLGIRWMEVITPLGGILCIVAGDCRDARGDGPARPVRVKWQ